VSSCCTILDPPSLVQFNFSFGTSEQSRSDGFFPCFPPPVEGELLFFPPPVLLLSCLPFASALRHGHFLQSCSFLTYVSFPPSVLFMGSSLPLIDAHQMPFLVHALSPPPLGVPSRRENFWLAFASDFASPFFCGRLFTFSYLSSACTWSVRNLPPSCLLSMVPLPLLHAYVRCLSSHISPTRSSSFCCRYPSFPAIGE